jgi:hypothetical protein
LHDIRIMTQRSERWLIVGACVALYALAMGAFAFVTRNPVRFSIDWLIANFGLWGAAFAIGFPLVALWAWVAWRERDMPPVEFTPPKWPRWVRIIGNTYLALLGVGLIVAFGAMVIAG